MATSMGLALDNPQDQSKYTKGVRHLCEEGVVLKSIPTNYIFPIPERPTTNINQRHQEQHKCEDNNTSPDLKLPVIDLSLLQSPTTRPNALQSLAMACEQFGFFQVVNHGIEQSITKDMIDVARRFFDQPYEERVRYMSGDIRSPVRCGTSFNLASDKTLCWRDFLKLSCHPLPSVLPHWPSSPMDLREKGVSYASQTRKLFQLLIGSILESLGLTETEPILEDFKEGTHMMMVNFFPACPEPELTLGMPPHSDYGFLTFVLQDGVRGLQIQSEGEWVTVEPVPNSILVNVGDHLEIFSNGRYKSVLHRVTVNSSTSRISVASLHSLPFHNVVRPSPELIDGENPELYKDADFSSFLDFISTSRPEQKSFIESRKIRTSEEEQNMISSIRIRLGFGSFMSYNRKKLGEEEKHRLRGEEEKWMRRRNKRRRKGRRKSASNR